MKKNKWFWLWGWVLLLFSCQTEVWEPVGDATVQMNYRVSLEGEAATRAISDGSEVNRLLVEVFTANDAGERTSVQRIATDIAAGQSSVDVTLQLVQGQRYDMVFWAYRKETAAYDVSDLSRITVDYEAVAGGGFAEMEHLDAFYAVQTGVVAGNGGASITLKRPFAQLNFGNSGTTTVTSASLTVSNVAAAFDPFAGMGTGTASERTFTYSDFPDEQLTVAGTAYDYIAMCYLFVPSSGTVSATLTATDGNSEQTTTVESLTLEANKRYNLVGSLLEVTEFAHWRESMTEPVYDEATNCHYVSTASELAWWQAENQAALTHSHTGCTIYLQADIDMLGIPMGELKLPDGATLAGNNHTVSNVVIEEGSGLLGTVSNLTVKELVVSNAVVTGTQQTGTGVLFGSSSGTLTLTNISISDSRALAPCKVGGLGGAIYDGVATLTGCTVTGGVDGVCAETSYEAGVSGQCGGLLGYLGRSQETDTSLEVMATLSSCSVSNTTVKSYMQTVSRPIGKLVGTLNGYDLNEKLNLEGCSATNVTLAGKSDVAGDLAATYVSPFNEAYKSAFTTVSLSEAENDLLGGEAYCRGKVYYNGGRFTPRWDGSRTVKPLTDGDETLIYSAPDLAYLQGDSLGTIRFKEDVDLGGMCDACRAGTCSEGLLCTNATQTLSICADCHHFTPIYNLANLYGENHTLYNLHVQMMHMDYLNYDESTGLNVGMGAGLVCGLTGGTVQDFTFDGANIKCIYNSAYKDNEDMGGNAYAGTLASRCNGSLTLTNVHVKNGKVTGISKIGGLLGAIWDPYTLTASDCTVDNYTVENTQIFVNNHYEHNVSVATISADFYTEGEAGGFIGFISATATIDNCHSSNVTMKCYGCDNQTVPVKSGILTLFDYTIAGRHVNAFIGDIRTPSANVDVITNCSVTNYSCGEGYDYDITQEGAGEIVGCCYFVGKSIGSLHSGDNQGSVTIDGEAMPFVGG